MHIHFLDPYQLRRSPVHSLDARVKLILAAAFILTVALAPPGAWPVYLLLLAFLLAVEILSDLGIRYVVRRSLLAVPFVLAAVPVVFTIAGPAIFTLEIGSWTLTATQPGMERFISITLKSWLSIQAAILLTASTPFPDLLAAMRAVRVPRLLVAVFSLMWRYLYVMADEAIRLLRARSARSGTLAVPTLKPGGSLAWRARVAGGMAGNLFLRAFERSDRIYMAMLARGYTGDIRSFAPAPLKQTDWLILYLSLLLLLLLSLAGFLLTV